MFIVCDLGRIYITCDILSNLERYLPVFRAQRQLNKYLHSYLMFRLLFIVKLAVFPLFDDANKYANNKSLY